MNPVMTPMSHLVPALEAVLFAAGEPVSFQRLAKALSTDVPSVETALGELAERLSGSGLALVRHDGSAELVTASESAAAVEAFQKNERQDALSRAALEVLSVIAYRGPVSRNEIESIRGVNCSFTLRNLLLRGLIEREEGESGRGYAYRVSFDFLKHLGIDGTASLPDFEALSQDERVLAALTAAEPEQAVEPAERPVDSALSASA